MTFIILASIVVIWILAIARVVYLFTRSAGPYDFISIYYARNAIVAAASITGGLLIFGGLFVW